MVVKVLSDYADKNTGYVYYTGDIVEYDDEARVKELASQGFVEPIKEPKKAKNSKK